ncbi:hypothetical protein OHC33_005006 [Knufia fluminis]|uniref:Uncharacterized protein n=1 Tax=Knufia fluminis TaxID=191047 RepID=A0AAN8IN06_9EURO|nr:hypothetical protein OHC33_005006 [Knufia fluminis]
METETVGSSRSRTPGSCPLLQPKQHCHTWHRKIFLEWVNERWLTKHSSAAGEHVKREKDPDNRPIDNAYSLDYFALLVELAILFPKYDFLSGKAELRSGPAVHCDKLWEPVKGGSTYVDPFYREESPSYKESRTLFFLGREVFDEGMRQQTLAGKVQSVVDHLVKEWDSLPTQLQSALESCPHWEWPGVINHCRNRQTMLEDMEERAVIRWMAGQLTKS